VGDAAADLHAAVPLAVLEADLERQLEVLVLLLAAQEGVVVGVAGRVADDGAVLDAPVLHQALPAFEVLAVEEVARGGRVGQGRGGRGPQGQGREAGDGQQGLAHRTLSRVETLGGTGSPGRAYLRSGARERQWGCRTKKVRASGGMATSLRGLVKSHSADMPGQARTWHSATVLPGA